MLLGLSAASSSPVAVVSRCGSALPFRHNVPERFRSSSSPSLNIQCANHNGKPKTKQDRFSIFRWLEMKPHSPFAESSSSCYRELKENEREGENKSMWAKLGQRFNPAGIMSSLRVIFREQHLALPHLSVQDIRWINWKELKKQGFQGIVFDKDNTLTAPYAPSVWPDLSHALEDCKSVFDGRIALLSNSAGLYQYDPDGSEANALEKLIGIPVIRHGTKKPAGTAEDIEKYFGFDPSLLVMVGDRHFTDIVYGNRNGFLTILTEPLTLDGEPFIVRQIRKLEGFLVQHWSRKGLTPATHHLLLSKHECIKDPH